MKRTFLSTLIAACLTLGLAGTINVTSALVVPTAAHASVLGKIKGAAKKVGGAMKTAGSTVVNAGKTIGGTVGPLGKTVGKGAVAVGKAVGKAAGSAAVGTARGLKQTYNRLKPQT
jgi:hypothetical protein